MLTLDDKKPAATVLWKGKSDSEIQTDGLHAVIATPVILGDNIYGICSYGQFRCAGGQDRRTVWETQAVTKERARWATGIIVRNGERLFINNDRGELIIVKAEPEGYRRSAAPHLIKPTSPPQNRRELVNVNWSYPAYANRHIYARNDEEIIAASLAADQTVMVMKRAIRMTRGRGGGGGVVCRGLPGPGTRHPAGQASDPERQGHSLHPDRRRRQCPGPDA